MVGRVDHRDRPIINLQSVPPSAPVPTLVDTGFNGDLIIGAHNLSRLENFGFIYVLKTMYQRIETIGAAPYIQMGSARIL
jgi:hypothetical protein